MIKRMFCLLSAAVMLSGSGSISAYATAAEAFSADSAGFEYRAIDSSSCEIVGYTGSESDIDIPGEIDSMKVVSVAEEAFSGNSSCTVIIVPGSVKKLGRRWAYGCTALKKITYKNGVRRIGKDSSCGCPELSKVILPPSIVNIDGELADKDLKKCSSFYFYRGTYAEKYLKENKYHRITLPGRIREYDADNTVKGRVEFTWRKVATADGYQIQICEQKYKFKKNVTEVTLKGKNRQSYLFKDLKGGRRYTIRARSYRVVGGKKYYGPYNGFLSLYVK